MLLTHLRWWQLVLAGLRYTHMLPGRFVSFPFLVLLMPSSLPNVSPLTHLPDWTLFLSFTFTAFAPLCTCISLTCINTGLEMGRSPSSIYFATTLVLWPERSHILSLDRSSSLAKATALLVLGSFPLSTCLPVVKCSLRSVLRCARNRYNHITRTEHLAKSFNINKSTSNGNIHLELQVFSSAYGITVGSTAK